MTKAKQTKPETAKNAFGAIERDLPSDWDDNPEWTDADFARSKPFKEVFPKQFAEWEANKGGRPRAENPKVHIGFRLAADVVQGVRASGRGYNARVEEVLREALKTGRL